MVARFEIDGIPIDVVGKDDLVRLDRASGRDLDRIDADQLERG